MPGWYVSYAWGDDTPDGRAREEIVERLCAAADDKGFNILRDKNVLGLGDSISGFMRRIGAGDRIFVIFSEKYLRSPFCMFELSEIWRTSRQEGESFLNRIRIYNVDGVKVRNPEDWADWAIFWKEQHEALDNRARQHGAAILGEQGHRRLMQMQTYYTQITDILGSLADIVQPRSFEELQRYGFDDLLDLPKTPTQDGGKGPKEPIASSATSLPESEVRPVGDVVNNLDNDILLFLGRDPVAGNASIARLAASGPEILETLLKLATGLRQHKIRLKKLCMQLGSGAIPNLLNAVRAGSWDVKCHAAPCFAAFRGSRSAEVGLYRLLEVTDFDVQRLAIEAAGHVGYYGIRFDIVRLAKYDTLHDEQSSISDYSFGKLSYYVLEALMRFFSQVGEDDYLATMTEFAQLCIDRGQKSYVNLSISRALEDLASRAADSLVTSWLRHPQPHFRDYALECLAHLRLQRTIPVILPVMLDPHETVDLRRSAGITLAAIGGAVAARHLAEIVAKDGGGPEMDWAFSVLYAQPIDWPDCSGQIDSALQSGDEVRQQMLVSLGWRQEHRFRPDMEHRLSHHDPVVRWTSALAYAHLLENEAIDTLKHAADEAATDPERVFMLAAQIYAGAKGCGDALHAALQTLDQFAQLRPWWKREVLSAIAIADGNLQRAELWAEIAGESLPRVLAETRALRPV